MISDDVAIAIWWLGICLVAGLIVFLTSLWDRHNERQSRKDAA